MKIKLLIGAGVALAAAIILAPVVMEKMKPVNPTHNAATATTTVDTPPSSKGMTPEEAEALEEADAASADPDVEQPTATSNSVAPNTTETEGGEE